MRKMLPAAMATALVLQANAAVPAASFDGDYRGTLDCAKLSWTKAPLTGEPVTITIRDGKASYSRVLYGVDRGTVVGQESGSGTVTPDGAIALSGGFTGRLGTMQAAYKGKIAGAAAVLNGTQTVTFQGKTESRACGLRFNR